MPFPLDRMVEDRRHEVPFLAEWAQQPRGGFEGEFRRLSRREARLEREKR